MKLTWHRHPNFGNPHPCRRSDRARCKFEGTLFIAASANASERAWGLPCGPVSMIVLAERSEKRLVPKADRSRAKWERRQNRVDGTAELTSYPVQ